MHVYAAVFILTFNWQQYIYVQFYVYVISVYIYSLYLYIIVTLATVPRTPSFYVLFIIAQATSKLWLPYVCVIDKTRINANRRWNLRFDLFPINIFFFFFFSFDSLKSRLNRGLSMDGNDLLVHTRSEPNTGHKNNNKKKK